MFSRFFAIFDIIVMFVNICIDFSRINEYFISFLLDVAWVDNDITPAACYFTRFMFVTRG